MAIWTRRIPERIVPGCRLGRHVEHDERSRGFGSVRYAGPLESVAWERHGKILDQEDVGMCTGAALIGLLMTEPNHSRLKELGRRLSYDEWDALDVYKHASYIDTIPGSYPKDDTGSTGVAAAKAGKMLGLVDEYRHAFGRRELLEALQRGPVMIGIDWYDSFDTPQGDDARLVIRHDAEVRGGHEVVIDAVDLDGFLFGGRNSWGPRYGLAGGFTIDFETMRRLLEDGGDVIQPSV